MKKFSLIMVLIIVFGLVAVPANAVSGINVELDGKVLKLNTTAAFVDDESKNVYVPVRAIAEAIGLTVAWDNTSMEAVINDGSQEARLKSGEAKAKVNNESVALDSKIISKSEKLYAPVSFFEKNFSLKINWNEKNGKLDIKSPAGLLEKVSHLKQSTIRIQGDKTVYIDPFSVEGEPKDADIIFITHTHGDHYSAQDIKKVMKKDAIIVITADGVENAKKDGFSNVVAVEPSKSYETAGVKYSTVASYNTNKDFHKKDSKWVGYIIEINNVSYYLAGDTDKIQEMGTVKADVAFLPVGGTYTMTAKEAIEAAGIIKPKVAVPIHFGDIVGTSGDAKEFIYGLNKSIKGKVLKNLISGIEHGKQSTIRINSGKIIYVDPVSIEGEPKDADLVFVTHTHGDHYSVKDIKKLMKDTATLIIPADGAENAKKEGIKNIVTVEPDKTYEVDKVKFETVPAYNKNKDFHPKANNWVGYIISINSTRYYMAGDTDSITEMGKINADVVFLPVGGTYTMDAKEAAAAANTIKPVVAVPIHFADVVGTVEDAKDFIKRLFVKITGIILKK